MKKYITAILSVCMLFSVGHVFANDAAEADMVILLTEIEELNSLMEGYQIAMKGYEEIMQGDINSQLKSITGTNTLGSLLNGESDQEAREWSPEEWAQAVAGGNNDRYNELLKSYQDLHPTLNTSEASSGISSSYATDYQQQVDTNQAANTQATYAFNDTNKHLENIKTLSDEIDKAEDTKHIEDLNARLNTEIAYLQVEVIKGLAVVNEQLAQQQATEIHDRTEAAKFNQIPE